ncbi:MAG TPA: ATP-dependent RecD-like DNA helicase [Clostridia bacterium]|nr:ATP-dependent RecD-like DNA helicase [Clostridia bacterium]HRU84969.1 ATP-dependent RecD-like DNA helicase [Eubacteriales bacterium]
MKISGEVKEIIYVNSLNGYSVVEIFNSGVTITAVGIFPPVHEGEIVELTGDFENHKGYGRQFAVTDVTVNLPSKIENIKKYLSSGLIKGLGEVTAAAIVNTYGSDSFEVMNYPMKLAKVKGISLKKATEFGLEFQKIKGMQDAIIFLQKYGISINLALKIYRVYQNKTEELVRDNPYRLVDDIEGVGFITADKIARELGIDTNSNARISAAIIHTLKEASSVAGHTYLPLGELVKAVSELLRPEEDISSLIEANIEDMGFLSELQVLDTAEHKAVMLKKNYSIERGIAKKIAELEMQSFLIEDDLEHDIAAYERANSLILHQNQKNAIKNAITNGVAIITGGPGTGKTTIIKGIISVLKNMKLRFVLAAPTGRAAKRLSEATGEDARTIHRILDLDFKSGKGYFTYNEYTKLETDVAIIDEVSMVDEYVFYSFIKALYKGTRLILVGDKDQLPSVGAGNVLADLIASSKFDVTYLTEIYRQEKNSLIVENAHRINKGKFFTVSSDSTDFFYKETATPEETLETTLSMCVDRLPGFLGVSPLDIQVLCPMKKGIAGAININARLQDRINPKNPAKKEMRYGDQIFREGDKVMQIVNNYQQEWAAADGLKIEMGVGVFNGDIGVIERINLQNMEFTIRFDDNKVSVYSFSDLDQIILSYAVSVHKSQGSEFDAALIPVSGGPPMLLTRNLLYTAVTRAKKAVVLIGPKQLFMRMIKNNYTAKRFSLLKQFILEEYREDGVF